jgi:glucokinase
MTRVLALDVGGTNVRLAIALVDAGAITIESIVQGPGRAHATFDDALLSRRDWWASASVERIAIACAGPVVDGVCHMTNLGWVVDARAIAAATGLPTKVINDFEAVALGVRFLPRENLVTLQAGQPDAHGVIAILGAGTGMGQALVVPSASGDRVMPTEGGHATLSPVDDDDARFIAFVRRKIIGQASPGPAAIGGAHVSIERALAGAGMVSIFEWLVSRAPSPATSSRGR